MSSLCGVRRRSGWFVLKTSPPKLRNFASSSPSRHIIPGLNKSGMDSPSSSGSSPTAAVQDTSFHLQADPDSMPIDEPAPIEDLSETEGSFFPSPPAHYYKLYTTSNLAFASTSTLPPIEGSVDAVRSDLEPPYVEWIVEDGSYSVFGERWPVVETLPGLQEMGVKELFNKEQGKPWFGIVSRVEWMDVLWTSEAPSQRTEWRAARTQ